MGDVTRLLQLSASGDPSAQSRLYSLVYSDLNAIARKSLSREATCTQIDASSLVHEAYLRLAQRGDLAFENRRAFFGYAARVMRSVILDYLRERLTHKRGGGQDAVTLSTSIEDAALQGTDLIAVDAALRTLAQIDQRSHDLFEMHFFAGMEVDDLCAQLDLSPATVRRDLRKARTFLVKQLCDPPSP